MTGKSIVATIVRRDSHDCAGSVSCQYIVAYPNRNLGSAYWVYGIRPTKHTCYTSVSNTFALCTFFCSCKIFFNSQFLFVGSEFCHQLTFGGQNHKSYTKNSISTGGENFYYLSLTLSSGEGNCNYLSLTLSRGEGNCKLVRSFCSFY